MSEIKMIKYGLHPSLWRAIRKVHSGGVCVDVKNKDGSVIGECVVSRYENVIHISNGVRFLDIDFGRLIDDARNSNLPFGLSGTNIPIGHNSYLKW